MTNIFKLSSTENELINAHNVIIATGGVTYGFTGSTGDGSKVAELLGHQITDLKPGGVPLKVREKWVHNLKGVTLKECGVKVSDMEGKKLLYRVVKPSFNTFRNFGTCYSRYES